MTALSHLSPPFAPGTAWLVGAGPGDPGLLTVHAINALGVADVVIYDALVDRRVLSLARDGAVLEYAGKRGGQRSAVQRDISERLIQLAREGFRVLRLKGGDPFVFGRGGEEALALARAGVAFEIVPGVSSISAVPASAGIPITHRGVSSQVTVVAGHDPDALDLDALAACPGTLVVFMGLKALPELVQGLLAAGRAPDTPAAVISRGSTPAAETVVADLAAIADAARSLAAPALVVVGDVVALSSVLGGNVESTSIEYAAAI
jgi:uroporphyrin-III C-methyltransferase